MQHHMMCTVIIHCISCLRLFFDLCDKALQLYGQLASKEQALLLFEMNRQFITMKETLAPILNTREKVIL